ncbi:MAG: major capsid protein [Myxococcota bacterium]
MSVNVIDVTPQGTPQVETGKFLSTITQAVQMFGRRAAGEPGSRYDSATGYVGGADVIDQWRRYSDSMMDRAMAERGIEPGPWIWQARADAIQRENRRRVRMGLPQLRQDAVALKGGHGGRIETYNHVHKRIWEEKRQPLNAMRLFPIDTGVPVGARQHTAIRELGTGNAEIHQGGNAIPRVDVGLVDETFETAYVIASVGRNFFEALSTDYAGWRRYEAALRLARRVVDEKINEISWKGAREKKLYGILNYPSLAKQNMAVDFTDTPDPKAVLRALQDLVNTPKIQSGARFKPNRLAVSVRIHAFLHTRKHEINGGTDTTIAEFFLRTNGAGITAIEECQELDGIGPNGEDGILAYRDELDTMGNCIMQPTTVMPVHQSGPLDQITVVWAGTGGFVCGDVGNCILGFARAV